MRPKLLDLFCGAGGAGVGYFDAGFDVVGVDAEHQPDYPFPTLRRDAISVLEELLETGHVSGLGKMTFDAIHASPPCQASCTLTKGTNAGREYVQLIPATRDLLEEIGLPSVLENVQGSDLRRDLTLCGEMFGLDVIRHRYFEVNGFEAKAPEHIPHRGRVRGWNHGVYHDGPYFAVYGAGGGKGSVPEWQKAMGIDWTEDRRALAEAIPPAYTRHIGLQLRAHLDNVRGAA
jgi:DNA (cytosine-5)-methyltransferase 1